ncbi:uncharacterized protein F4807DRAFT_18524 [Annulohypoxylon truncatum]|uniref:uncharacterized protein n=1 Tax=Annulohypoxylon truncatum TaxID=327061 RepID=UPI0020072042|nr:uncharacterized protein F4807DRAFT_18524 [Annulohypoxylon truncatum]KAI1215040.1 hypothetical protein F4807DRAFT_18524 [Annulohypoxylon truncatum]
MDTANASDALQQLVVASKTPIADLNPELADPASRAVRGVVTITWPYSFVKGTFSFILAEPDYRLRRNKGQIRINLVGASAKAASESGLSSNDEVLVSLDGAEWEPEQVKKRQSLPGAGVDWQLKFSERLLLQVTLAETGETKPITVNHNSPAEPEPQIETPPIETSHVEDFSTQSLETLTPPSKTHIARLKDGEFDSPAFVKRARMSYGSLFEDGYDIFEEDGGVRGRGRKRSRFGRESGAWKYTSQSPSPEPASPQNRESSPPRPEMTDEGCQTMDIDFPMPSPVYIGTHLGVSAEEAQNGPNPTPGEHATQPSQGMVDHGVQGTFHGEWPTTTPVHLPPFDPGDVLPSHGPELPAFHHTDHFHPGSNDFQQGWDPRSMELPPTSYPNATEQPPPNNFVGEYDDQRPDRLGVARSGSHKRSPSEPSNLAIDPTEQDFNGNIPTDEQNYPIQDLSRSTAYPPLDLENEEQASPNPEGGHLDYPPSYLDDHRPFSQEAMPVGTTTFSPGIPAAADAGPSLWTTINEPPQEAAMSSADRLGSTEGESIDNAVIIDESDSDGGPPPPTAAEDTVMQGHADDLDMYEEAEVEDEIDAEYSEDDEPEYEADEIGGDYDTRNYTGPDDDEDDSHDEDLRPHDLEPEFDDGRSWEGEGDDEIEDEDAENPEYDSEYDMDEDDAELQTSPQPISQSTAQVIDLISSSEDESEDDEDGQPQPPSNLSNNTGLQIQPESIPTNISAEATERVAQSEGEEDEGDEAKANESDDGEENGDDEVQDDISVHSSDDLESEAPLDEDNSMEEFPEEDRVAAAENSEGEDVATSPKVEHQQNPIILESPRTNDLSMDQRGSPQPDKADTISILDRDDDGDNNTRNDEAEKDRVMAPQSAAEGLEMLSRVVESESKANNELAELDMQDDMAVTSTSPEAYESLMDNVQGASEQGEHEPQDTQQDEPVELVSTLSNGTSDPQPMEVDEDRRTELVAPSSPLIHSFISQPTDEKMTDDVVHGSTLNTDSQIPAGQLPTPRATQVTGDATASVPPAGVLMEVNIPSEINNAAEPVDVNIRDISFSAEQSFTMKGSSTVIEDASIHVEEQHVESTSTSRQQTPLEGDAEESIPLPHLRVSPGLSFQTQVSVGEMAQASFTESTSKIMSELEVGSDIHSDVESDTNGASVSFVSQMDEELQASILEYSQDFEEVEHMETPNEHEIGDESDNYDDEVNTTDNEDETHLERHLTSRGPSPELGNRIEERQETQQAILMEDVDTPEQVSQVDPSVQLARAANASKRQSRQHDTTKITHANGKKPPVEDSTALVEDPSVQLARASFNKGEEESNSMTAAKLKLVRHLRDELPDCTSLKVLRQHLQKKLSVIAIAMMQPPDPQRAKGGPREFMMSFTITDYSIGPYSVVEVYLYRPHKETLPIVKAGDVVLLRNFTVVSIHNKGYGLRTNDESSWAVFDQEGEPPQIKGPPVEYDEKETAYVAHLRAWFNLLDEKARAKLERANKKMIDVGRSK